MRIAIFSAQYLPHLGGIETFTHGIAKALAERGNDVYVITNDTDNLGCGISSEGNIKIVRLPCIPLISGRLPLPYPSRARRSLIAELKRLAFDAVLINARFYHHSLLGMSFARFQGLNPMVLDHGSAWLSFSNPLIDPFVRVYERAITALGLKFYQPDYYGISNKSVSWLKTFGIQAKGVIANSIDAEAFRRQSSRRCFRCEFGIKPDAFIIAFVGRLIPEKGIKSLIAASRDSGLSYDGAVFLIAGDGPLSDEVQAAQSDSLIWLGRLGRSDIAALFLEADILCLPTRSEGFSTTLLEASSCGCPSVVTDVGGAKELIPDDTFGTILRSADPADVIAAIGALMNNRPLLETQKKNCRALVESKFSWDETARAIERAMKTVS